MCKFAEFCGESNDTIFGFQLKNQKIAKTSLKTPLQSSVISIHKTIANMYGIDDYLIIITILIEVQVEQQTNSM